MNARGNDDDDSPLGNDDDVVRGIHSNDRAVPYRTRDTRLTAVGLLQILSLFNDDPNVMNTANRIIRVIRSCAKCIILHGCHVATKG